MRKKKARVRARKAPSQTIKTKIVSNKVRMKVLGIGGGGGNAIMRMDGIRGVEFVAINTDVQDLEKSDIRKKIHIGKLLTRGMGAGMNPELGKLAAEENRAEILEAVNDADMVFLTAGFGGGTGSGATHVIADIAREKGVLTIAIVTKPFTFEGQARMKIAEDALAKLRDRVDALLVIPNDRIFNIIDEETSIIKSFEKIDDILKSAVQGITEVISSAGLINVDFADLKTVISGAGNAVIGVGISTGKDRAVKATTEAINSPLLENSIGGARGVIFCVVANKDLRMSEVDQAAKIITANVDPTAKIIFGAYNDRKLKPGQLKVIVVAAGFGGMPLKTEESSFSLFPVDNKLGEAEDLKTDIKKGHEDGKSPKSSYKDKKEESKEEDMWDIPAFLRKKKK